MNYNDYVEALVELMPTIPEDVDFQTILPRCIEYAENRCYGDLDLISTRITNDSGALSANGRLFTLPTNLGTFIVVEQVGVFDSSATLHPLLAVSREHLDFVWPSNTAPTTPSIPTMFAIRDQATILVGPAPDSPYSVEIVGTIRPTPLSTANLSTPLTQFVPQLFVAASMVFMSGYMRDFSPASDEPQMPVTWEQQYKSLLSTALIEEFRKKWQSVGATSRLPSPALRAQPE